MSLLIASGANVNLSTKEGWSALDLATTNRNSKVQQFTKKNTQKNKINFSFRSCENSGIITKRRR